MYSVTIAALYLKFPLITNTTTHIVRNENEDVFRWSQKTAQHLFTILFHLLLVILLAFRHLLRTTHVEYTWYQKHIRRKTTVSYQAKEWRTKPHNSTHISETMRQCKHKKTVHGIFVRSRPVYIKAFRHLYYTITTLEVTGREKKGIYNTGENLCYCDRWELLRTVFCDQRTILITPSSIRITLLQAWQYEGLLGLDMLLVIVLGKNVKRFFPVFFPLQCIDTISYTCSLALSCYIYCTYTAVKLRVYYLELLELSPFLLQYFQSVIFPAMSSILASDV